MMLKRLALLATVLSLALSSAVCQTHRAKQKHNDLNPASPVARTIVQHDNNSRTQADAEQHGQTEVRIVNLPQKDLYDKASFWVSLALAIVAFGSAMAALRQAHHIVVSERAWMIAAPENPNPPVPQSNARESMAPHVTMVLIRFFNKGKTPAFIGRISTGGCVIPSNDAPNLSDRLVSDELGFIPVVPEHHIPWNHPRITAERAIKIRTGELVLWIYGTVEYKDAFRGYHRTDFCFRWEPTNESGVSEWIMDGPQGSNRTT